ncbi:MAG: hypothetical protein ABSB82_10820 [Terriglobia bacterium]|jgi:hypothetical protein
MHVTEFPFYAAESASKQVSSLAIILALSYSTAVSRLRRPFLSHRYFFITVRLLKRRAKLSEPDFPLLARAFNRARALQAFYLTAWVFLPDHWHAICAPPYPLTVMLSHSLSSLPFGQGRL